jgi:GNAT superfamily N-acetyltransferase
VLTITGPDRYELSTDPRRVDVDRVHRWLSVESYWAKGRPRDVVVRSIATSTIFGVYRPVDQIQVAFARAVTDGATFAWLCDVFVDGSVRGRGIGGWLISTARDELAAKGVRRILLATADAHGVYARLGFAPLSDPTSFMELDRRGDAVPRATSDAVTRATSNDRVDLPPLTVET